MSQTVTRTTVPVYRLTRQRAQYIGETGTYYSFSPCKEYHDRVYDEICEDLAGDLSDNYRLVTLPVYTEDEETRQESFAIRQDETAPTSLLWANGCYYDGDEPHDIAERLQDADWCIQHKVLTNLRPQPQSIDKT